MKRIFNFTKNNVIRAVILFVLFALYTALPFVTDGKTGFDLLFSLPFEWLWYSLSTDIIFLIVRLSLYSLICLFIILTPLLSRFKWVFTTSVLLLCLSVLLGCTLVNPVYAVISHVLVVLPLLVYKKPSIDFKRIFKINRFATPYHILCFAMLVLTALGIFDVIDHFLVPYSFFMILGMVFDIYWMVAVFLLLSLTLPIILAIVFGLCLKKSKHFQWIAYFLLVPDIILHFFSFTESYPMILIELAIIALLVCMNFKKKPE